LELKGKAPSFSVKSPFCGRRNQPEFSHIRTSNSLCKMVRTNVVVIGASISGLASAVSLQKKGMEYILLEKEAQVATPWRRHYDRLHLHTNKRLSSLPYKKFGSAIPRYASRQQVVNYLDEYKKEFRISPFFYTEAQWVKKEGDHWITETNNGRFHSNYLVIATGPFSKPKPVLFKGMETFPGRIMHSYGYRSGEDFIGQKVLVVGFGNSACEIAIDLYEQGASPYMAVRSAVNIVPRDVFGIPILEVSQWLSRLPAAMADKIAAPVMRMLVGNFTQLGLKKKSYGVYEQFKKEGQAPVLDIGTLKLIREGHIQICAGIDHIEGATVYFSDGRKEDFNAIVAAIGYDRNYAEILDVGKERFDDLKSPIGKQQFFGKEGLYFCGFWVGPAGQIREISMDAQKIAKDIAEKHHSLSEKTKINI
jgi:indole-3-pyruvate monooxygenase